MRADTLEVGKWGFPFYAQARVQSATYRTCKFAAKAAHGPRGE
mgnify:CR=1 FL=1